MNIRPCRSAEIAELKAIMVEAFTGVSIDEGIDRAFGAIHQRDWKWRKARHLDEDLNRPEAAVFVVEQDNSVVGFISTWIDRPAGIGNIPNIAFRSEFRGQGLGRRLIQHALDHFRSQGITHAKIETLEQNDVGQHLYTSIGFREVARQIHFVMELDTQSDQEGHTDQVD